MGSNGCSPWDNVLKSRMCGPQVRFCERRRGASPSAYSTGVPAARFERQLAGKLAAGKGAAAGDRGPADGLPALGAFGQVGFRLNDVDRTGDCARNDEVGHVMLRALAHLAFRRRDDAQRIGRLKRRQRQQDQARGDEVQTSSPPA